MAVNPTGCHRFERRDVIKFSVAEKCKTCEICKRKYAVYGKAYFSLKIVYKRAKHAFSIMSSSRKDSVRVETHWLSAKEKKVPDATMN